MAVDLKSAEDLQLWNKRILSIGGMWPLETTLIRFYLSYVYFISQVVMAVGDFINVFGNLTLMIANLLETSVQAMIGFKMLVLRHSGKLKEVLHHVHDSANEKNYRDETEKKLYLDHIQIGRRFFKTGGYSSFITTFAYYLTPLKDIMIAAIRNETMIFVLPYRVHFFFNTTDTRVYALIYLSQCPMVYFYYCHSMSVFFLCTLIVHVTGEMSVLAHRIRLIGTISMSDSSSDYVNPEIVFRQIVNKHQEIMRTASAIDDIFNIPLLEELAISTVLIGLTAYNLLANAISVSLYEVLFFAIYSISLLILVLVYCITGDYLIRESVNIHDAYYECQWYDMNPKYQKNLIICMARARKPQQLTAGRFYVFSLPRYSDILKTIMAYISMLRAVV